MMQFIKKHNYRHDFHLFKDGKEIYFDNACQTLRPRPVINAITEYYEEYPVCAGRGVYEMGGKVTNKIKTTRKIISKFINSKKPEEIIFTRNTTEGINLIASSLNLKKGDVVLTTDKEHNSNLIPWQKIAKEKGIIHKIVPSQKDNTFNINAYKKILTESRVKLVSMGHISNLDGVSIPAEEIIKEAHLKGALVMLDGAQSVPHTEVNVRKLDVDFLAFSGHKLLGPTGTGVLYGKYKLLEKLEPFMVGGDTVDHSTYEGHEMFLPPRKFEAGLQNYAGIIGLGAAVKYLQKVGFKKIKETELKLNTYITEELQKIENLHIIGPANPTQRGGIISFYIDRVDSHKIALILDNMSNIMIRSGRHCVHSWFEDRGIKNSARVSLYFYNTKEECEIFIKSLKKILSII